MTLQIRNSVVYIYIFIFSNSQWMSVINNNNNVPIYKHFHVSWYTKQSICIQWPVMMSTYTDETELISTW